MLCCRYYDDPAAGYVPPHTWNKLRKTSTRYIGCYQNDGNNGNVNLEHLPGNSRTKHVSFEECRTKAAKANEHFFGRESGSRSDCMRLGSLDIPPAETAKVADSICHKYLDGRGNALGDWGYIAVYSVNATVPADETSYGQDPEHHYEHRQMECSAGMEPAQLYYNNAFYKNPNCNDRNPHGVKGCDWYQFSLDSFNVTNPLQLYICDVIEGVGGRVDLQEDPGSACHQRAFRTRHRTIYNPPITLTKTDLEDATVLDLSSEDAVRALTFLPTPTEVRCTPSFSFFLSV